MSIRCVVVTPERTELDREADFVALPMYDGELGVQTGRAPMIGRLGYGVLRLQTNEGAKRYFVDGGFAQVEADVVSVLTGRAIAVDSLSADEAAKSLGDALDLPSNTPELAKIKDTAVHRARGQWRAAR